MKSNPFVLLAEAALVLGLLCTLQRADSRERSASVIFEGEPPSQKKDKDSDKKDKGSKKKDGGLKHLDIKVAGQKREALVAYPDKKKVPAPVIFVFHGHGNTMKGAAESFECHEHWDDAICVYPQGLKTPSPNDPLGKESGWELEGPRDYLFFDALLADLIQDRAIDTRRIYSTGFSNGAFFTFGLWAKRGSVLRAVASCGGFYQGAGLGPKPCLLIAGKKDKQFEKQEDTIEMVRRINGCEGKGIDWPLHKSKLDGKLYPSTRGAPTVKLIHNGGHSIPNLAGALIVEFFKDVGKN